MKKNEITVIIPIHEITDITKNLLTNAIKSVGQQIVRPDELLFVIPIDKTDVEAAINDSIKETMALLTPDQTLVYRIIYNTSETDFCSQMNFGVDSVTTKYFSFLEIDDEYSKIWLKNAVEYITAYPEVGVFLPLIVDVTAEGAFIGFTNETVWANQFSDELGFLDLNSLLTYQNFNIDGMVMNTETYKELGGLKSKIQLTFIYEFLLRLAHNDIKIMTLPKFGYKHINQREGSLFYDYKNTLTPDESKWWLAQAKKEYYFDYDRAITYDK
jgi:hypothetical protein